MCDCEEIQKEWRPSCGDWFVFYDDPASSDDIACGCYGEWKLEIIGKDDEQNLCNIKRYKQIWLPRQDQLQGMLDLTEHSFGKSYTMQLRRQYNMWEMLCKDDPLRYSFDAKADSMEQLWLAFVMKEKHGAIWTGSEWDRMHWTKKEIEHLTESKY